MSKIYISAILAVIAFLYQKAGLNFVETDWTMTITNIVQFGTAIVILFERYKKGDINVFGQMK